MGSYLWVHKSPESTMLCDVTHQSGQVVIDVKLDFSDKITRLLVFYSLDVYNSFLP